MKKQAKAVLYTRYPLTSVMTYNGVTLLHYGLGAAGIIIGYNFSSWAGLAIGTLYLAFALIQMYVIMPLTVCPNCLYYELKGSRCISAKNILAQKISSKGDRDAFPKRAEGLLCHNNLYLAALVFPILAMLPALFVNFSAVLLILFLAVIGLLLIRFFVLFTTVACLHCRAKYECPNAIRTGVRDR